MLDLADRTVARRHQQIVIGRDLDVLLLQIEALGITGFEVAAWLETRNIFLELATRQVSLPNVFHICTT